LRLEFCTGASGCLKGRRANRARRNLKAVVFLKSRCGLLEGMLNAKVAQGAGERATAPTRGDAQTTRQGALVTRRGTAPNPLFDLDKSEGAQPTQAFFFPQ